MIRFGSKRKGSRDWANGQTERAAKEGWVTCGRSSYSLTNLAYAADAKSVGLARGFAITLVEEEAKAPAKLVQTGPSAEPAEVLAWALVSGWPQPSWARPAVEAAAEAAVVQRWQPHVAPFRQL